MLASINISIPAQGGGDASARARLTRPMRPELRGVRPHRPELRGASHAHAKEGGWGGVCDPRVFCASKNPTFLTRWRVQRRPAVRGTAGTGSVGDGVGEDESLK